jgi:hypothetical protein
MSEERAKIGRPLSEAEKPDCCDVCKRDASKPLGEDPPGLSLLCIVPSEDPMRERPPMRLSAIWLCRPCLVDFTLRLANTLAPAVVNHTLDEMLYAGWSRADSAAKAGGRS